MLIVAATLGALIAVVVLVAIFRPANRQAEAYIAMTQHGTADAQAEQAAVSACLTVHLSPVSCRDQLQALDDQLVAFQHDLDRVPAPSCLQESDRELRAALRDDRLAVQEAHQAGPFEVARVHEASDLFTSAGVHYRASTDARRRAIC